MGYRRVLLPDGIVEVHLSGPADAPGLLVFHVGTPSGATEFPGITAAAARRGLRTLVYGRPGYGESTRMPGRRVADEAVRTATLADRLGYRDFYVIGWSGGGPPALACAALLPDRVRACLTLASPAPPGEVGVASRAWRSEADAKELEALAAGDWEPYLADYEAGTKALSRATPASLRRGGGPASPAEERVMGGATGLRVPLARSMRRGLRAGMWGWFDDVVAMASDWGFRVADIEVPVVVRHGTHDRMVDPRQGEWLASTIPGAVARMLPERGHGSVLHPVDEVLDELIGAARGGPDRAARPVTRSG